MSNILIAEDNEVNRELLRELLESHGHNVAEACNGQEALDMIAQIRPQILLLDIGMPVRDGFSVVKQIRADPLLDSLPVMAITAYAMQGDRERILNSGFDGYLSKPIDANLLFQEINRLLVEGSEHKSAQAPKRTRAATSGK
jgi:CheY-like chemotaxis protein